MLVTSSFPYGPGEGFLHDEIEELASLTQRVVVVPAFPRGELSSDLAALGNVEVVSGTHLGALRSRPSSAAASVLAAASGREVGVRHAARNGAGALRAASLVAKVQRMEVDHIHAYWLSVPAGVALRVSRATGVPWSASAHRFDIFQRNKLRLKLASAGFVRTISRLGTSHLQSRHPGANIHYVPLGVRQPGRQTLLLPRTTRVLCAANFVPIKGHEYLIRAVAAMQRDGVDVQLDLAGTGPTLDSTLRLTQELALRDVQFLGQLPRDEILRGYDAGRWRLAVLPSVDLGGGEHEGVPISLVEAMSRGIPVVSTTTGSIPDLLGQAGPWAMVTPSSPERLAASMSVLLQSDAEWERASDSAIAASAPWRVELTAARLFSLMEAARSS